MVFEQQKQIEVSKANTEVQTMEAQFQTSITLANIEAEKKAKLKDAELQEAIEVQRAKVTQERERAERMSKTTVEAEIMQTIADAEFYKSKALADAKLFKEMKEAEADKILFEAQSDGIKLMQRAFHGDNAATLSYIMLEQGLHAELAKLNATAIEGLAPKITVWNTDGASKGTIQELMQSLPPVISTIQNQTGIKPPAWMADVSGTK
jgi:flotillin